MQTFLVKLLTQTKNCRNALEDQIKTVETQGFGVRTETGSTTSG